MWCARHANTCHANSELAAGVALCVPSLSCSTWPSDGGGGRPACATGRPGAAAPHQQKVGLPAVPHPHLTASCTPPPPHCWLCPAPTSLLAVPPHHCQLCPTPTSLPAVPHPHLTAGCAPPPPHCRLYSRYTMKMDSHERRFASVQCRSPAAVEVAQLRETLAGLAERSGSRPLNLYTKSNMLMHESFGSCSGAVLLAEGGVDVLSGQETDRLETTLGGVRGRAAAALARRQEAQEQAASHRQKRDKVVQASNLLKVGRAV